MLFNGDCLELMKDIPDNSIDMILCDLPYGVLHCKWDKVIPFEPLWEQYNRIIKDKGAIVLFGSEPFSSHLRMSNIKNYKYDWIWNKNRVVNHLNAKKQPLRKTENISVFNTAIYYPVGLKKITPKTHTRKTVEGCYTRCSKTAVQLYTNYPNNILKFDNNISPILHPTQKPVPLLEYLIKTYTLEGETVLDNCMGSGSTGVACVNTNRNFIGIELEENYFQIAKNRIEQAIKDKACEFDFGEEL